MKRNEIAKTTTKKFEAQAQIQTQAKTHARTQAQATNQSQTQHNYRFGHYLDAIVSGIQKWWEDINDPRTIQQKVEKPKKLNVRVRLKELLLVAIAFGFFGLLLLSASFESYSAGNVAHWLGYQVCCVIAITICVGTIEYRKAMAISKDARIEFEQKLCTARDNLFDGIVLLLSKLIKLVVVVLAISVALQYVPGLEEHVPRIMQASKWVIENFNSLLEKVIVFFSK